MEHYVSAAGTDTGSGSLIDPWQTLDRAIASGELQIGVLSGCYSAPRKTLTRAIEIVGRDPEVLIGASLGHGPWTLVTYGAYFCWTCVATGEARNAMWSDTPTGVQHRIPVWKPAQPTITSPAMFAELVLNAGNSHLRWGLWSAPGQWYLVPPPDGSWTDPNQVIIRGATGPLIGINGPDVHLDNIRILGGIRMDASAQRAHLTGVHVDHGNIGIYALGSGPTTSYGFDHLIEKFKITDDGTYLRPGESVMPGLRIPWNAIKASLDYGLRDANGQPILVKQAAVLSEVPGISTQGGALNVTVQDGVIDGTFDGASHYMPDDRYDDRCDSGLTIRRVAFRNHGDDALDRSRYQRGVVVEDCTFENVGTVLSPAPLWGDVTLRRCQAWTIGEQARVPDGNGKRPPGSIVKCGGIDTARPQGVVHIEDSILWTDTPTTQGVSQDGGVGPKGLRLEVLNSVLRAGSIVVNWPYPTADLVDQGNTWSTSGPRPLKPATLPIQLTPAAAVDARYYDPRSGRFADPAQIARMLADLQIARVTATDLAAKLKILTGLDL